MKAVLKSISILFLIALISAFSFDARAQQQKERFVLPVDGASRDASFVAFREKLIAAVRRRDAQFLLATIDPNIKIGFGGNDGVENFKKFWKIDRPNSPLWDELLAVLTNGGSFSKESKTKEFCAPYTYTDFPEDLDGFEDQMIFGSNVNLRARPNAKAAIVAKLSYNVVRVDYENSVKKPKTENEYVWLKIKTLGGKQGFVPQNFVRSHVDYRACFEKQKSGWRMIFFVAGD